MVCTVPSLKHHPASRGPDCLTETEEEEEEECPVYSEIYHIGEIWGERDDGKNTTENPKIYLEKTDFI